MKYVNVDVFAKKVNKSRRTIFRFYEKKPELKNETKKKNKRLIPMEHLKYWNPELLYDENKLIADNDRKKKNLLDYLHRNDKPIANFFWRFDWTFFIGINYKDERSKDYCISMMNLLYDSLNEKFGNETKLRILFSTEAFEGRNYGHHNHVVLYVQNKKFRKLIEKDVIKFFMNDRVYVDDYDMYKGGIHYMLKEGTQGVDWGVNGNNLEEEGIRN